MSLKVGTFMRHSVYIETVYTLKAFLSYGHETDRRTDKRIAASLNSLTLAAGSILTALYKGGHIPGHGPYSLFDRL